MKINQMKKLLFLSVLSIFACSSDGSSNNDVSDNEYFFEIEFAGEIHRIQGTTSEMFTNGQNSCSAYLQQGIQSISFKLDDVTADDYVSGQPIWIGLGISNPQLGNNPRGALTIPTTTPYIQEIEQNYNVNLSYGTFVENSPGDLADVLVNNLDNIISNINITDLGSPPSNDFSNPNFSPFGDNIKGTYEGVLYYNDKSDDYITGGDSGRNLVIPFPIKIRFSAPRTN